MAARRHREPTTTSLVFAELMMDDLLTNAELARRTGRTVNQVSAATFSLVAARAIDWLTIDGMTRHFFATPEADVRTRVVNERVPESTPRKQRRRRQERAEATRH